MGIKTRSRFDVFSLKQAYYLLQDRKYLIEHHNKIDEGNVQNISQ